MLSNAALEILELAPLWRLKSKPRIVPRSWQVFVLADSSKRMLWLFTPSRPAGNTEQLLGNILRAMALQVRNNFEINASALPERLKQASSQGELPQGFWLTDPILYQDIISGQLLNQNACAPQIPQSANIWCSEPLEHLLSNGAAKAQLWRDWCNWASHTPLSASTQ